MRGEAEMEGVISCKEAPLLKGVGLAEEKWPWSESAAVQIFCDLIAL